MCPGCAGFAPASGPVPPIGLLPDFGDPALSGAECGESVTAADPSLNWYAVRHTAVGDEKTRQDAIVSRRVASCSHDTRAPDDTERLCNCSLEVT